MHSVRRSPRSHPHSQNCRAWARRKEGAQAPHDLGACSGAAVSQGLRLATNGARTAPIPDRVRVDGWSPYDVGKPVVESVWNAFRVERVQLPLRPRSATRSWRERGFSVNPSA